MQSERDGLVPIGDALSDLGGPVPDERFACGLLSDHLTMRAVSEFQCTVIEDDPPDLVVTWENGARWGVEVTRTYPQVESLGGGKPVSSAQTAATLRNFAEQLREKTKGIRKRGYTLHLEGPGPFSSWKKPDSMKSMKRWKEETEDAIRRHIASEENGILRIPGIWLKPSEPGKRWTIATDSGAFEIRSTTATMIWRALENKTKDLPKWNGTFASRWLLLLNCYTLVDALGQVKNILRQFVLEHPELAGFNGIFWSGHPNWTLFPISLGE